MVFDSAAFARDGFVRVSGGAAAGDLRRRVAEFLLQRDGVRLDAPVTWPAGRVGAFQAMAPLPYAPSPEIDAACDGVLGRAAWLRPAAWGTPLVTFPQPGPWRPPHQAWHVDFAPRFVDGALPGVRLLALLDAVAPQGGGTMLLAGSHRLVERFAAGQAVPALRSADVRRMLRRVSPHLDALQRPDFTGAALNDLLAGIEVDGAPVRLVELTGSPGDVVLMHPWLLHAASENCSAAPRLMLSQSIFRSPGEVL